MQEHKYCDFTMCLFSKNQKYSFNLLPSMFDMLGWYWLASVECVASNHSTQLHAEQASKVHNREKGTFSERYDQDFSDAQKGTGDS